MSLLDDVSIVVTPNGYKAGELYAVIPVPTEGAELVPSVASIVNAGGGTITQISGNSYSSTSDGTSGSAVRPKFDLSTTAGKRYKLTITPTGTISGTVNFDFYDGSSYLFQNYDFTTTKEIYFIDNGSVFGAFDGTQTYNISSFTVSVKEYTSADMDVTRATAATRVDENGLVNYAEIIGGEEVTNGDFATDTDWTKGTGWTISGGNGVLTSGSGILTQTLSGVIVSRSYKLSWETGLNFQVRLGGASIGYFSGSNSLIISSAAGTLLEFLPNGTQTGTIDNVSVKEVTRDNVPRIDYTGGGCPHILAEPQRTNVFIQNDISTWNGFSSYADETTAPDGTTIDFVNMEDRRIFPTTTISNSTEYTSSIYLKGNKTADVKLRNAVGQDTVITLSTEWQRFELTATSVSTVTNALLIDARYGQGMGAAGLEIAIYGGQVEAGSYTTSYIPTSGSTVTRNQDLFTRDGIGSLINSTEGVLFVEMAALSTSIDSGYLSLNNGGNYQIRIGYLSGNIYIQIRINGSVPYFYSFVGTISDFNKIAVKWTVSEQKVYVNGSPVDTGVASTIFPTDTLNNMEFAVNGATPLFAKVKQLQVYDTALTDEQLLQLTGESGTDFYESYAEMATALTYTIQ